LNQEESMRSRLRQVVAAPPLVLAALWGGCRDLPPTTPRAAPDAPSRDWTSEVEWHAVGSFDIPVPIQGAIPWTSTGITVNDTGWVRVQVTGGVVLEFNKDYKALCAGPTYLQPPFCPMGAPLAGASLGPDGRRAFDDYLAVMVGIDRGNGPEFVTTGWFTDSPGFFGGVVHGPGTIMVARRDLGWTINGLSPFDVKGQELIRVDVIGAADSGCGATGAAKLGIRSLASNCVGQEEPSQLVLDCTPALQERTQQVGCTASAVPQARSFTVSGWQFTGGNFTIVPGALHPERAAAQNRSATWSGPLVASGEVIVTAEVNGATQSATAHVEVSPRSWKQDPYPRVATEEQGCALVTNECRLKYPPERTHDLAQTRIHMPPPEWTARAVQEGPNEGLWYIPGAESPLHPGPITMYLAKVFSDARDPYWRRTDCTLEHLKEVVVAHENTHIRFNREFWESRKLTDLLEGYVVQGDRNAAATGVSRVVGEALTWWYDSPDGKHNQWEQYPRFECTTGLLPNQ
jgi:hypothetical protein